MQTTYLSARERKKGQDAFLTHAAFNGFGYSFLADTVIYLLAMEFAATNLQLGYISSAIHIAGIVLPFVPWFFKGRNIRDVFFVTWLSRGLVCILYAGLLLVNNQRFGSWMVVGVYSLFCLVRSVGVVTSEAVQKTLVTPASTGDFLVRFQSMFQATKLGSQVFNFLYFSINVLNSLPGLLFVQLLGVAANSAASLTIRKIPCRETIEYRPGLNMFTVLSDSFSSIKTALPFLLRWLSLIMLIQGGFLVPFLRRTVNLEANIIFAATLLMSIGAVIGNRSMKPFADRIGSKFLLSVSSLMLALVFCSLVLVSPRAPVPVFLFLCFLYSLFQMIAFLLVSRIVIKSIPEENKMTYSAAINFSSALLSLVGGLAGGLLADLSGIFKSFEQYDLPFLFGALLCFLIMFISLLSRDVEGMTIREAAQVVFSSRNLRAFLDVYQLSTSSDRQKKQTLLYNIGNNEAPIAAAEVRRILSSPYSPEKAEMFRHLYFSPSRTALPLILHDAALPGSFTRRDSIFALGAYSGVQTEQALRSLLNDEDPLIFSSAVKSLARIGCRDSDLPAMINKRFGAELKYPEVILNYIIALYHLDPHGEVFSNLFGHEYPDGLAESVFCLLATLMDAQPPLSYLYQQERYLKGSGLTFFLDEAREQQGFLDGRSFLRQAWQENDKTGICSWIAGQLAAGSQAGYLYRSLRAATARSIPSGYLLAMLYFTFRYFSEP